MEVTQLSRHLIRGILLVALSTRTRVWLTLLFGFGVMAACGHDNPVAPSEGVSFTVTDLVVGSGATVGNEQRLTVDYTSWRYDSNAPENKGTVLDTTAGRGPFTFTLAAGQVIA